jgi:hypothetical protein
VGAEVTSNEPIPNSPRSAARRLNHQVAYLASLRFNGSPRVKGASIPIMALTMGFPLAPVRLDRNPELFP